MPAIDWSEVLGITVSPWELFLRGTAIYWFLFLAFRLVVRRDMGAIAISDILLVMLVADAAQNAMASDYRSIVDGIVLISTILGWNVIVDWVAYASPRMRRLLVPRAVLLVHDGTIMKQNLRREFLTQDELEQKLRENGVTDLAQVKAAYMESDGAVSVQKHRDKG
ncbi:MAG: DUF421 domain-containing protein [Burkholderiales bacterium]|nr:DUF421 domain-containing protein [Burkholderiales bacterium]